MIYLPTQSAFVLTSTLSDGIMLLDTDGCGVGADLTSARIYISRAQAERAQDKLGIKNISAIKQLDVRLCDVGEGA
jgi:hypothetical protein